MYFDKYQPKNYKYVGKNTQRKDAHDIVTGKATFLNDFTLPRMLIGRALRSPHAHARITNIDTSEAKKINGVACVLTYEDVNQNWKMGWPPTKPILGKEVKYVGDMVALVAAETKEIADEAIAKIKVDYEILPAVTSGLDALKEDAPQLYPEFKNNIVTPGYPPFQKDGPFWHLIRGDIHEGFKECAYTAEDTIEFAKMPAPASPETPGAIVKWLGGNDYKVWATSQSGHILKILNSTVIENINVIAETFNVGGSYGNKQSLVVQVTSACLLSRFTARPVKVYQTKVEQMTCFETRLGSQVTAKIGMDKDGIVRSVKAEWTVDTGCLSNATQGQIGVGIGESQLIMAKCLNWDLDTNLVVTNKQPAGIVRGYGGQELNSCLSILMGRTMEAGNFDPVEVYKKNFVSDGDEYIWRDGRKWKAHDINYVPVIEAASKKFKWSDKWKGWGQPTWTSDDGNIVRGVGCACIGNADVGEDNTEAYVRIAPHLVDDKAQVIMQTNITESGMGQRNNMAKIVAECMNVPFDSVEITPPDTQINPTGFGLCGSRGTITYGHALTNACEDLQEQLFALAEPYLEVSADAMELRDFGVCCKARPGKFVSWKKLIPQDLTLTGYGKHLENFSTPNFFIVFIEVEVDKRTGQAQVINMLGGTDTGQTLDPSTIEMQMQGGIGSASLDTALYEEHIIDPAIHRTLSYNMLEYKWRPFNEFPNYEAVVLESQFDTYQFKAIGVGEISGAPAASATMQAISNAIGTQVSQYPATPDVILKALDQAK